MRIQHNIAAMNSLRQLTGNNNTVSKSLEKLSSGYRINRAGDDAAGLAISEKMRAQIRGLSMASKNAQDGISLVQTAEGALTETHSILQRMRELAVQASNGIYDNNDRSQTQAEIDALKEEVDRISTATTFNNIKILDGSQSAECAAAKENARLEAEAKAANAEENAAIAARNQAKLDAAQAEYDAAKADYDAKTGKIVTNEDFKVTATYKDGTPLSSANVGKVASLTINFAENAKEAVAEVTTLTFTDLDGTTGGSKDTTFSATATVEIDGVEVTIESGKTLTDLMKKINETDGLKEKYTAQVKGNEIELTHLQAGAAETPKVKISGIDNAAVTAAETTRGVNEGVTAFKVGESVTIAGKEYIFNDGTAVAGKISVNITGRNTIENQMTALAQKVATELGVTDATGVGTNYTITNQDGAGISNGALTGKQHVFTGNAAFGWGATAGTGDLEFSNLYANTAKTLTFDVTENTTVDDVIAKINNEKDSLYTASKDGNGKLVLTAKEIGVAANAVTMTVKNATGGLDLADDTFVAATGATDAKTITSFTITAKNPGEDATLTELQYTSETVDGGKTVGTQGPLNSKVTPGVNKSEALEAKNATVTYELNLGDKSEITNGSEVTIAGKTFKIFNSDKAVVEAGATMNDSIVLENAQDEVEFTLGGLDDGDLGKVLTIGGYEFKLTGGTGAADADATVTHETDMYHNLMSAFNQSDLAKDYTLTIGYTDKNTNNDVLEVKTIDSIKLTAKDAATDVSALEVKLDGAAVTGQSKQVTTGEDKLYKAIQEKVSALTGIVGKATVTKDLNAENPKAQITFEAEYSDITGEEFMAKMGDLKFNANVDAAPELKLDEVELEDEIPAEYDAVTAEDMDNGVTFQIGSNGDADQRVKLQIGDMGAKALGIDGVDLTTSAGANEAIDVIDKAIQDVSAQRAQLGAMQNRLEHTINNLDTNNENLSAAESRIRDVDMAAEMMAYTKNNVLVQAAQSMLAQANQQPQSVLSLLQ